MICSIVDKFMVAFLLSKKLFTHHKWKILGCDCKNIKFKNVSY